MMKISAEKDGETMTINLAGTLTKEWVNELLRYWQETISREPRLELRIDLSAITFIDDAGKALLALLHRDGAQLVGKGLMASAIIDELTRN